MLLKFKKAISNHIDTVIDNDFENSNIKSKYDKAKTISKGIFLKYVSDKSKIDKYSEFKQNDGYLFLINPGNGFKKDIVEIYYDKFADHIVDVYNPEYKSTTTFKMYCNDNQFKKIVDIAELIKKEPDNFNTLKLGLNKAMKGIKFENITSNYPFL